MEESKYMEEKSMTVKELKDFIKDLPDNTEVVLLRTIREKPIITYIKTKTLSGIKEEVQIS